MNPCEEIIHSLSDCVTACEKCLASCLEEENVEKMTHCIKLDRDCSDICSLGVQVLSRQSGVSESIISLCTDICANCADECEKHDHEHCKKCAETCRQCEELCKTYLDNMRQVAMNA
ncbi:MAG: four-helix bundle copper-binding protein [Balneolaceae bacterium]|nr:four-helix bundle copper-binding protein [Balneolaceae bacterium]